MTPWTRLIENSALSINGSVESCIGYVGRVFSQSERWDLNPRPPLPQSGALPSCATPRVRKTIVTQIEIKNKITKFVSLSPLNWATLKKLV